MSQGKDKEVGACAGVPRIERAGPMSGRSRLVAVVAVAGVLVYLNSFAGVFLFDDIGHIVENESIRRLWPLGEHLLSRRPVVNISLAINYALGGMEVWGYHALNLAVHILAGMTLFGVVRRTLLREPLRTKYGRAAPWLALVVSLIWVVHPLQTQSVTYLVQRGESLMGLFYLLTLYCLIRGADSSRAAGWYAVAVASCALGMGSKAVMITAPVVVLLYDRTFVAGSFGGAVRRRWGLYAGLAATWGILATCGVLRGVLFSGARATATVGFGVMSVTPLDYALSQPGVIRHYLGLSLWPHSLCLDYAWPVARGVGDIAPSLLGVAVLLALTAWLLWRRPALGFCGAWFFIILSPTSSIVPIADLAFEHRMYLSLAAVVVLVVLGGHHLLKGVFDQLSLGKTPSRVMAGGVVMLVVVLLGYGTIRRNEVYHSAFGMWQDVVEKRPSNARAHMNLVEPLLARGRFDEAVEHGLAAVRLRPARWARPRAHNNLGLALWRRGRITEALEHYREALRLQPSLWEAHYNLGWALAAQGKFDEAIASYRQALRFNPRYADAYYGWGITLLKQDKYDEAIEKCQDTLRLDPRRANAHYFWGVALSKQGKLDEAVRKYRDVLRINPEHNLARRQLKAVNKQRRSSAQP